MSSVEQLLGHVKINCAGQWYNTAIEVTDTEGEHIAGLHVTDIVIHLHKGELATITLTPHGRDPIKLLCRTAALSVDAPVMEALSTPAADRETPPDSCTHEMAAVADGMPEGA